MQGRWVEDGNASSELVIKDGEINCFGSSVEYDYKDVVQIDGALTYLLALTMHLSRIVFNAQILRDW